MGLDLVSMLELALLSSNASFFPVSLTLSYPAVNQDAPSAI